MSHKQAIICIYSIQNVVTGDFYIGSSKNFLKRKCEHLWQLSQNKHGNRYLQRSWNKYGKDSFRIDILRPCSQEGLREIEQLYLDTLKPPFNIKHTVGEHPDRKMTPEEILLNRQRQACKPVVDDLGTYYPSMAAAERAIGAVKGTVGRVVDGTVESAYGRAFKLADDPKILTPPNKVRKCSIVDSTGHVYESLNEAARHLGIDSGSLYAALKNKTRVKGVFVDYEENGVPKPRKMSNEKRKVIDNDGTIYESLAAAGKAVGVSASDILKILKGKKRSVHGKTFSLYEGINSEPAKLREKSLHRASKPVCDQLGNQYQSVREASRANKMDSKIIIAMCKGKRKAPHRGLFFSYA